MKEKLLLLMMLCALSSLCHAQKITYVYDDNGNVIKRHVAERITLLNQTVSNYKLNVTSSYDGNTAYVRFYDTKTGAVFLGTIQVSIRLASSSSSSVLRRITKYNGQFDVDISWMQKNTVYAIDFVATPRDSKTPIRLSFKYTNK